MTNEFSIQAMKNLISNYTSKRVSRDSAEELGKWLTEHGEVRSEMAKVDAVHDGRKTVRDRDFKATQDSSPRKTSTDVPNAPVERIIRSVGVERVSEDAVEELKKELLAKGEDISQEVDRWAGSLNGFTISTNDFHLAKDRGE